MMPGRSETLRGTATGYPELLGHLTLKIAPPDAIFKRRAPVPPTLPGEDRF